MTKSSKTLQRLGVAGVAAVTMGAGLPALLATSASAAPATQLTLNPNPAQAAAGTCQVFTVDATDSNGNPATYASDTPTVVVQVTESPASTPQTISFCTPTATSNFANTGEDTESDSNATTAETATSASLSLTRTAPEGGTVTSSTPTRATFGIRSSAPGGASIRAFLDTQNSGADERTFQAGEVQVLGTASFTAGGTNTASNVSGGNAAQDAAATITTVDTNSPVIAGQAATATVNVKNSAGNNLSGVIVNYVVTAGPNGPQTANGTTTAGRSGQAQAVTDNAGNATIRYETDATRTGTDTVQFFVNQTTGTTGGADSGEPTTSTTIQVAPAPVTDVSQARNVTLTPETVTTVAGESQVFVARVVTASGAPVQGASVTFREEGPGRFADGSSTFTSATGTNAAGEARVTTTSVAGEAGTQVITVTINAPQGGNQTGQPAGTPTGAPAGNSSDTSTQTFVATAPTTAPPTTTPPTTTPPTTPATEAPATPTAELTIDVEDDTIVPTEQGVITVTGTPNAVIELFAYSRPSTTYREVRQGQLGEDGRIVFRILPGTNTRLFAQYEGQSQNAVLSSESVVQNVATALSLSVVRNGSLDYTFQGRILPRRAGQLITLYRVEDDGDEIITSQVRTDNTGTWRIRRVFTGQGVFPFLARTGQNLTNVAGESNVRPTAIYAGPQR